MQSIQSRLKSRKLLGVGEGADGLQHRSKITQLLGSDSLLNAQMSSYDYPMILTLLQYSTCLWFSVMGLIAFLFPEQILPDDLRNIGNSPSQHSNLIKRINTHAIAAIRLYGAAVLAVTFFLCVVTFFYWSNRKIVRIALLVKIVYFSCELAVAGIAQTSDVGIEWRTGNKLAFSVIKVVIIGLSVYYHRRIKASRSNNEWFRILHTSAWLWQAKKCVFAICALYDKIVSSMIFGVNDDTVLFCSSIILNVSVTARTECEFSTRFF